LKKGSDEYNVVQNKINRALGNKKVHGETTTTKGKTTTTTKPGISTFSKTEKRGGKKVVKTTDTDVKTKTTKLKKDEEGVIRKAKTRTKYKDKDRDVKVKTKYDKSGEITKKKSIVKEGDVVTKTITKGKSSEGDVKKRVKTRKRGGTGLGAKIKGIFKKKDKE